MDRGAWQATDHEVAKSWTQLSGMHAHPTFTTLLDSIIYSHSVSTEQSPLKLVQRASNLCLGVVSTLH